MNVSTLLKSDKDFKKDTTLLKVVLDKYSEVKKNMDSLNAKELYKARIIVERIQIDAYFGYLAGAAKEK